MTLTVLAPRKSLNKSFLKVKPNREDIERFKENLIQLLDQINEKESEEFHKNIISEFLKNTYYAGNHYINTKGRNDLVIHNGKDAKTTVGVIVEAKKPANKSEMLEKDTLNTKAFQELVLYYLRERITHGNLEVRYLVVTNIHEWFIFDVDIFEKAFAQNKTLVKQFQDFEEKRLAGTNTDFFYKEIAEPAVSELLAGKSKAGKEIAYTHFDIREYETILRNKDKADDNKLIALFKLLSPEHLLKLPFKNDSNSLDKAFYVELLHIIGLTEIKDGSKKLIDRKESGKRDTGSIIENAITQLQALDKISRLDKPTTFGTTEKERYFNVGLELVITWINRILFLKLLEAQLITYHKGDKNYSFLNKDKIKNFDDLNTLFFQVLAREAGERDAAINKVFGKVPYLNSSLFEPTDLEHACLFISQLQPDKELPILSGTVLKDNTGKKRTGKLNALEYLFAFLDAYDFSSEGSEEIQEENKTLISASVLGLIFEKINGYKDGSFFTPGFITMYMCRETIRRAVVEKFNEHKKWNCKTIDELYDKIEDKKEANQIINSLKICDPAVGSGHFLVSALNEIIAIKSDLRILMDRHGKTLRDYHVEVSNDELAITDENGVLFEYNPKNKESQRVQEALFHEKQTLIENSLFGVDINTNSVKICRLRLWIELLKNAYYKADSNDTELETLPNIDINIKCGNSLISRFPLDVDLGQALKKSKITIKKYREAVQNYRHASSKEEKREMEHLIGKIKGDFRTEISNNDPKVKRLNTRRGERDNLVNQHQLFELNKTEQKARQQKIDKLNSEIDKLTLEIENIKTNKIYENAFEWRFEFPEVLNLEGGFEGFDIVIGNPPWGANIDKDKLNFIKSKNSEIIVRMIDSFMFFISLSIALKSKKGYIALIVPDVVLYQIDNTNLRKKIIEQTNIIQLVNLGDNIFQDVARASAITILNSLENNKRSQVGNFRLKHGFSIDDMELEYVDPKLFKELPYNLFPTDNLNGYKLLSRIKGQALAEFIDEDGIQRGVSPDLKEAFIVTDEIVTENKLEKIKIRPTVTGGVDVKKYAVENFSKRLIYTSSKDIPKEIPNIVNFISKFKEKITCKEVKEGKHPIYALHRDRDEKIFLKKEKLIGVITGDKLIVALDTHETYPTDGLFVFCSNGEVSNKFLLALLNTNLFTYLYQLYSFEKGRVLAQIKPSVLENVPVIKPVSEKPFIDLIDKVLKAKSKNINSDTSEWEIQINNLVNSLYGLSKEEIDLIQVQ